MQYYEGRFSGKRAIVTGGTAGIGKATALRLAKEGARVGLISWAKEELEGVAHQIISEGGEALPLFADVSNEAQVSAAIDAAAREWGGLDIVVSNAGIELPFEDSTIDALPLDVWQKIMNVNLTGQYLSCKHGVRHLLAAGKGAVVMVASPCGEKGFCFKEHAYSSSKGGVMSLMKVMALDYIAHNIRVNAVIPGFIDTPMNAHVMSDPEQLNFWSSTIPIKRPGKADEVAAIILFLASDEASYVVGAAYAVDGGQLAG
jgi:NAD(P)-dependent dehydrogenase (short-subunit alcohol dehydrogenase family)